MVITKKCLYMYLVHLMSHVPLWPKYWLMLNTKFGMIQWLLIIANAVLQYDMVSFGIRLTWYCTLKVKNEVVHRTNRIILTNQNQSLCLCLRDNCLQEMSGIWTDNHLLVKSMEAWSTQCVMWGTGQPRLNRLLHIPVLGAIKLPVVFGL